ncbi:MAG: 3-oxoacyl-ACP synthase [Acidobacteria bacterium]|nr:3-oxoacyl-ACP synthase [Acidobacteriota bacterium]
MSISLSRAAVWLPEGYEDAAEIAARSGIPESVIIHKMGITRKCRARADEQPSMMAIEAARDVLSDLDPQHIDLLIWTGSEYKDHPVWSAGIFVQEAMGLSRAWAFDLAARCSSNVVGLHVARAMMLADPNLNRVLICGGHRTGDLVNYTDEKARFLFNLSDGGSAMLLERNGPNPLAPASILTDGRFSLDVIIPAGGTRQPAGPQVNPDDYFLTCPDIEGMRQRLGETTQDNFLKVIRAAQKLAQFEAIDYLALLQLKPSAFQQILHDLGLNPEQSRFMDHFGHFGAPDALVSLALAQAEQRTVAGARCILASAGIGYTWSAIGCTLSQPLFSKTSIERVLSCVA